MICGVCKQNQEMVRIKLNLGVMDSCRTLAVCEPCLADPEEPALELLPAPYKLAVKITAQNYRIQRTGARH